ncbi:hypothetical protein ACFL0I_02095 [Gemmatimonadota bacterium]
MTTTGAPGPGETVGQDPASEVTPELVLDVGGHTLAHGVGLRGEGQVALEVLPDDAV